MNTFLLTWNPTMWTWADLPTASRQTAAGTPYNHRWSTGNRTSGIDRDDRIFLLMLGVSETGIIAAGRVTSAAIYQHLHWNPTRAAAGETAPRVDVRFERILNPLAVPPQPPLNLDGVTEGPLTLVYWHPPAGGVRIPHDAAAALEILWPAHLDALDGVVDIPPDEGDQQQTPDAAQPIPPDGDWRELVTRQIRERRGQGAFRNALRNRYGDQCLISDCRLLAILEAAHIRPCRGGPTDHPSNGLLLRADLHTLFDLHLLSIEPGTYIVNVHPSAQAEGYGAYHGIRLIFSNHKPDNSALAAHWHAFQQRLLRK